MALFRKLISAVKKFLRGHPSSRKRKRSRSISSRRPTRRRLKDQRQSKRFRRKSSAPKKKPKTKKKSLKVRKPLKVRHAGKKVKKVPPKTVAAAKARSASQQSPGILVGEVTHYFSKIMVGVVKVTHGSFSVGDQIRIRGKMTDFAQKVGSLQIESQDVRVAPKGQLVGLKVTRPARAGDQVFKS